MPLGPFGEVVGTTGTLDSLGPEAQNYKSKVIAPRNPKLRKSDDAEHKVYCIFYQEINSDSSCLITTYNFKHIFVDLFH